MTVKEENQKILKSKMVAEHISPNEIDDQLSHFWCINIYSRYYGNLNVYLNKSTAAFSTSYVKSPALQSPGRSKLMAC